MSRKPWRIPLSEHAVFLVTPQIEREARRRRRRWWLTLPLRLLQGLLIGMLRVFMKVFGPRP